MRGIIYSIHIEPAKREDLAAEGAVITFVARLPETVEFGESKQFELRGRLERAFAETFGG